MRKIVFFTIGAIAAALLSVGLSFIGDLNLVWIVVIVLMLSELEVMAVIFAVVSGFFMDVFLHANIGATSISILIGLAFYVLAKSVRIGGRVYEKVLLVIIVLTVSFVVDAVVRDLIGDGSLVTLSVEYLLPDVLWHGVGVAIGIGMIRYVEGGESRKSVVTLK